MLFFSYKKYFIFLFIFFSGLIVNKGLFAQNSETPFSSIKIGLNIGQGKNSSFIEKYWKMNKTAEAWAEFPFYFGNISAGAGYLPHSSKEINKPDFKSYYIYLGLGKEIKLPYNTSVYLGTKFGNYSMSFADDTINVNLQTESEFAAGINVKFNIGLFSDISLNLNGDLIKVFTKNKISVYILSAGINYKFNTPAWIKEAVN